MSARCSGPPHTPRSDTPFLPKGGLSSHPQSHSEGSPVNLLGTPATPDFFGGSFNSTAETPSFSLLRWLSGEESTRNAGDVGGVGSTPGSGAFPGEGNGNQYPCLENPMDRGAWWAPVHGLQSQT